MLKFTMKKDFIQVNIKLKRPLTLKDRINLIGDFCQLLEQEDALAKSDEVSITTKTPLESEELSAESEVTVLECNFCKAKNPLESETCSQCHGAFEVVGGREVKIAPGEAI